MGIFSFIKDAGEKIFGKEKEKEEEHIEITEERRMRKLQRNFWRR